MRKERISKHFGRVIEEREVDEAQEERDARFTISLIVFILIVGALVLFTEGIDPMGY